MAASGTCFPRVLGAREGVCGELLIFKQNQQFATDRGQKLIRKTASALKDKGQLLIADFIPNDERTGPMIPMLFGLNMLIRATPGADVFTMREYRTWLKEAGFRSVKTIPAPSPSPLILATK